MNHTVCLLSPKQDFSLYSVINYVPGSCLLCSLIRFLGLFQAEARLAAKRAARAEAREIRMKELERQQKEVTGAGRSEVGSISVRTVKTECLLLLISFSCHCHLSVGCS